MIDLHCHYLPGIDDGPSTMAEALDLARAAVADGITHAVLTSHVHPDCYPNQRSTLAPAFAAFQAELIHARIPLEVRLGGEARLCPELIDLIAQREVPFLGTVGGHQILLLEFPHQAIPVGSAKFVTSLLRQGIRPLIAHPERNKAIMDDVMRLREFADLGCWLQITAGSVAGRFGERARETAFHIIDQDWNCLLSTDAHNLGSRAPLLSEARDVISARYSTAMARSMTHTKAARILGLTLPTLVAA